VSRPATGVTQLAGRLALGWFYCRRRRPAGPGLAWPARKGLRAGQGQTPRRRL